LSFSKLVASGILPVIVNLPSETQEDSVIEVGLNSGGTDN